MLNKVTIIGNLGADPEVKSMNNGDKVANFSVAVTDKWKDKNTGEQKSATEWINIVIFGKVAEIAERYLKKGSKVYLEGKLKTRSWDQDGVKKYKTEVVLQGFDSKMIMLGDKGENTSTTSNTHNTDSNAPVDDLSDNIPF